MKLLFQVISEPDVRIFGTFPNGQPHSGYIFMVILVWYYSKDQWIRTQAWHIKFGCENNLELRRLLSSQIMKAISQNITKILTALNMRWV